MYISVITLWCDDVDRAVAFYTQTLGWAKTMDAPMGEDGRWVTVAPTDDEKQTSFTLMPRSSEYAPPKSTGMSGVIVEVDDVFATHDRLSAKGVFFAEAPRKEPWGGWASFTDSEGNTHGLHSPATAPAEASAR